MWRHCNDVIYLQPRPKGDDTDTVEVVIPGASPTATVSSTATDGGVPNKGFDSIESAKAFDSEDQKEPRTTPNYEDIGRTESSKQLVKVQNDLNICCW